MRMCVSVWTRACCSLAVWGHANRPVYTQLIHGVFRKVRPRERLSSEPAQPWFCLRLDKRDTLRLDVQLLEGTVVSPGEENLGGKHGLHKAAALLLAGKPHALRTDRGLSHWGLELGQGRWFPS